ncbi:transcriptional regulator [candidate division KSB1 bacterium]|nr:transcriptional regulator [candidate division KSB1 bacterium]MBL7094458.1 transcriptional regulator [candidate division KSB1 bacterium]
MQKNLALTLTGRDRIGIVEQVTKLVLYCGGNVESSRMTRLGGEFAMLMLVTVPEQKIEELNDSINSLQGQGFTVTSCQTEGSAPVKYAGWIPYQVEVNGADHEGIIHLIAHHLAEHNINIETMDTNMVKAPMSGTPLFMMTAVILAPSDLSYQELQNDLKTIADELNMDINISSYTGK